MNRFILIVLSTLFLQDAALAQGFTVAKYGGDFLSTGGGARALAMGSAYSGWANDVSAIYWNPAGLVNLTQFEMMYMHSERFEGIVGYDFAAVALPLTQTDGVVGLAIIRQGVDDIPNTLSAYDPINNQPLPNPEGYITRFSSFDLAFLVSYAQPISDVNSWGVNFKILNSKIGPFAEAWGYSLDLAFQERDEHYSWGIVVQDVTTMFKFWQTNREALKNLENFDDVIPTGQNEQVLPTVKLGYGHFFRFGKDMRLVASFDTDIRFENLQTYYLNWGRMSFEPHIGTEFGYKSLVFIRAGLTDFFIDDKKNYTVSPTFGLGLAFSKIELDYGMGSLMGMASELGQTHRISLKIKLNPF